MKYILVGFINLYQMIPGPWHDNCKYRPTCSNYAIDAILTYGSIKGTFMAIGRICRCNPWSHGGYDPVKKNITEK